MTVRTRGEALRVVEAVTERQRRKGEARYQRTLRKAGLTVEQLLTEALEEVVDEIAYLDEAEHQLRAIETGLLSPRQRAQLFLRIERVVLALTLARQSALALAYIAPLPPELAAGGAP